MDGFLDAYHSGGFILLGSWLAERAISFIRMPFIQGLLPRAARWEAWPRPVQQLVVFLMALVAMFLQSVATGAVWWISLLSAIPAALGAIGWHKGGKLIGQLIDAPYAHKNPGVTRRAAHAVGIKLSPARSGLRVKFDRVQR